jgi:hypothetical protein
LLADHRRALYPGVQRELDHGSEVGLELECAAEFECGFELDSGYGPEVDLDHKYGLDLDLVHAQPQLTQLVGQQQWTHLLDYQELDEGQAEAASVGPAGVVVTIAVCHALDGASLEDASLDAVVPRGLPPNAELAVH